MNEEPSYGRCYASLALGLAPFFVLIGVAGMFGANTTAANGQYVHGVGALVVAVVLNAFFPAIIAGVQKLGYLILRYIPRRQPD